MVKNEIDIIAYWLHYHGSLIGYENIFIIDNYSSDGTFEYLLNEQKKNYFFLYQLPEYKNKGFYMSQILRKVKFFYDFYIPLDTDEFLISINKNFELQCPSEIISELENLRKSQNSLKFYKFYYLMNFSISELNKKNNFDLISHHQYSKTFINLNNHFDEYLEIDHGNHMSDKKTYDFCSLCLFHFPFRKKEQLKKKTENNLLGLNYNLNKEELSSLINLKKNYYAQGNQHIYNFIYFDDIVNNLKPVFHARLPKEEIIYQGISNSKMLFYLNKIFQNNYI
jgi:hypothetical protein